MKTKIYSGVPIPKESHAGAPQKYPFDDMKPGEHFLWECRKEDEVKIIRSSISTSAKQRGYIVKTRTDGSLIRCWMVGRVDGTTN